MATGGAAGALRRFELDEVRDTGKEVGHGSYAVVKELEFRGLKCVGKKIHDILFNSATPNEQAALLERFAAECELLGGLHHPCIVQFLGVCFEQGSPLPVLVMEYLHTTLSACLEKYGVLPKEISYGVLRDVALGLRYLHELSPPIVHRDLSANNVLLTSNMNAKLSDLGVAKILNLTPARMTQMTQTKAPGTPCYMPPEALTAQPKYTSKIDIYSYGVLIIHTLCGRWPFPGEAFHPDPQNPDAIIPASEVERRAEYLQEIGNDHPLMGLVHRCLSNISARRPEAHEIISTIMSRRLPAVPNMIELLRNAKMNESIRSENQSLRSENDTIRSESENLRSENDKMRSENQSLRSEINTLQSKIQRLSTTHPHQLQLPTLQWKKCGDMPLHEGMSRSQAVLVGEKVYVGGGTAGKAENMEKYLVFRYNPSCDEWSRLPPHSMRYFAMDQFTGNLITVGGKTVDLDTPGNKVYRFEEESQKWEEFLKPMPTARFWLSVATTQSAIIASGGATGNMDGRFVPCATVEVYSSETSQWYTADPLPITCYRMTSTILADTYYLLGGNGANNRAVPIVLYTSLTSLVQKAISPSPCQSASCWKFLPDTPFMFSAAANLSGSLLAVGGGDGSTQCISSAVHIFLPFTNSWVRVMDDLPEPRQNCTAVQLSSNQVLVITGVISKQVLYSKGILIGTLTL